MTRPAALAVAVGATTVLPGFLTGALALQIRAELEVSVAGVGTGVAVFFAAGALAAAAGGRMAQRVGGRRAMRGAVLASALSMAAIAAFGTSLPVLLVLLALAGAANGVAQPAINLFMTRRVPEDRQGLAFGIKQAAIPAAILVSGLALPLLALPLGWRPTFALCAAAAVVVLLTLPRTPLPGFTRERSRAPLITRPLLLLAMGAALASFGPSAMGSYLVAGAVESGLSEGGAGLLLAACSAASFLTRVAFGARADRRGDYGYTVVVALLLAGVPGFLLLATEAAGPFIAGAMVAFALGWAWPGVFNLAVVVGHRGAPAVATGITQTGIYVGATSGPAAFGLVSSELGYSEAWVMAAVSTFLAAALVALAARA
jgi:predicted MFS family arabinose efflux permease